MQHNDLLPCLFEAISAAKEAGEAILGVYSAPISVEFKDDRSPLTLADKRSNDIISRKMNNVAAGGCRFPILSEEGREIPYEERIKWEHFWLVDPLDGTKEFIKKNGEFTVNIALIRRHEPVMGVIYVPVKGTLYFALEGLGAFKLDDSGMMEDGPADAREAMERLVKNSRRLPVSGAPDEISQADKDRKLIVAGSRSHSTPAFDDFLDAMKRKYGEVEFISAGSSLKLCLVAEGKADIYPRFGPTMEWDTAAGQCIVEQSGGRVLSMEDGKPLPYNKKDLKNSFFSCEGKGIGIFGQQPPD